LRVVLGAGGQAAADSQTTGTGALAGEAAGVLDQRREQIGEIVDGEAREIEPGLEQIA